MAEVNKIKKIKKSTKKSATKATSKKLVIVESPSKARTIGKYLGSNYKVVASVGHIRDLPKSKLGIRKEENFEPEYINVRGKGDLIRELRKEATKASKIFLATDPDREGEAISWHLANILGLDEANTHRIEFNEITKTTVKEAIDHPRMINQNLVDAQQARRVLDRLVGYEISPLLWRKIRRGLSAGRVQSATLKMICDREREVLAFIPERYFNIHVELSKQNDKRQRLIARLFRIDKQSVLPTGTSKTIITEDKQAQSILDELKGKPYVVESVDRKERKRNPYAPYTTSSLQQDAAIKLAFLTRRTMSIAQQLYEGVDIKGHGTVGLITYLRTDSVRVSVQADAMAKMYIKANFGEDFVGDNLFFNRKKDIQDAHEAIRPTDVNLEPDMIQGSLTPEQYKLYKLIWSRFLASRMCAAVYDSVAVDIRNGRYIFRANGSTLKFEGFLKVYKTSSKNEDEKIVPPVEPNEVLDLEKLESEESFTQPPPRYNEASLVKELEENNIGRPSTYVPIIATLGDRKYIRREKKLLIPTDLGFLVNDLMVQYFKQIVDVNFTAGLEDKLDEIETKGTDWHKTIGEFYAMLDRDLQIADKEIEKVVIEDVPTGEDCELCGKPLVLKHGRFGEFIACSGYPECKFTKNIVNKVGVACPECGKDLIARRSKKGLVFYGCSGYPECKTVFWRKPIDKKCPKCGNLLQEKGDKKNTIECSDKKCDYKE